MLYDEDNDLFKPETFGEKIRSHTSDIIVLFLLGSVVFVVIGNKKTENTTNKIEQSAKSVQCIQKQKTIFFNDSVNQKIY